MRALALCVMASCAAASPVLADPWTPVDAAMETAVMGSLIADWVHTGHF